MRGFPEPSIPWTDDTTGFPVPCSHCHLCPYHLTWATTQLLHYKFVSQSFSSWYNSSRRATRFVSQSDRLYNMTPLLSSLQTEAYALSRRLRCSLLESTHSFLALLTTSPVRTESHLRPCMIRNYQTPPAPLAWDYRPCLITPPKFDIRFYIV